MNADADPRKGMLAALGRIPSGLFILTTRHDAVETAMLASWVQQCSFEPPQVSVAVKRGRDVAELLHKEAPFALHILDDSQTTLLTHFGKGFQPDADVFKGLDVERLANGLPILSEALAYLECRIVGHFPASDHDLFIGQVVGGKLLGDGHPMVHIRKNGSHY